MSQSANDVLALNPTVTGMAHRFRRIFPPSVRRTLTISLSMIALLLLWEASCRVFAVPEIMLPSPSAIGKVLVERHDLLLKHGWATMAIVLTGFLLALVFGIVIAGIVVNVPFLSDVIMPLLLVMQLVPKVALAPILLIWLGYGAAPKIVITVLISFFPILVNTITGLSSVERSLLDLARSLEATRWQIFRKFRLPVALPALFDGMKVAITLAVIGAIIGEFVGGSVGLGYLMMVANSDLNTPMAFAALFILSLMGITLYFLVEWCETALIPWNRSAARKRAQEVG
jgi:NitT/TauT family transport system permease protein